MLRTTILICHLIFVTRFIILNSIPNLIFDFIFDMNSRYSETFVVFDFDLGPDR